MARMEQLEMNAHRAQPSADVKDLVDKYRAIFDWDAPEVDEALAVQMIVKAVRQVLDELDSGGPVTASSTAK